MKLLLFSILTLALAFSGCSKKSSKPTVQNIQQIQKTHALLKNMKANAYAANMTPSTVEVETSVTFNKTEILNQSFLYGADLQHSSIYSEESQLFDQVYAMGHEIVFFRKIGNHLQLVADQSWKFESDVNKPERLINEFLITAEDTLTITVEINKPSPVLRQMFWGAQTDITRSSWIRSIKFDPKGNYLLIESSMETTKGDIVEHMESIFPRGNIAPNSDPLLLTDDEPLASRFKFLSWFSAYRADQDGVRQKSAAAFKYNLSPTQQVKWYVTSNVPDDILVDVKNSVEAWNRYFQKMWGTDGLIFAGKLPADVKLGDPRYNVIVWDNVQDGDAAYESQAVDPITGIQSHSNIYIPFSWLKTAKEYWTNAQHAEKIEGSETRLQARQKSLAAKNFMGSPLRFGCLRDLSQMVLLKQNTDAELHDLAREVLKGVIMHEVGHGLGMDHNFKGSLINQDGQYTASIMDYNHYNLEVSIFDDVNSATGPLLEYDRQFLDALYNKSLTSKDSAVLPACNDEDADTTAGGIDPLCNRYDAGTNPYTWMKETISLIEEPTYKLGLFKSLNEGLADLPVTLGTADLITAEEQFTKIHDEFFAAESSLFNFYITGGAHSLRYMTQTNFKSLKGFKESTLENTVLKELDLRQTTIDTLDYIFKTTQDIPAVPNETLKNNLSQFVIWAKATGYYTNLSIDKQAELLAAIDEKHKDAITAVEMSLAKLRTRLLQQMTVDPNDSYYFSDTGMDAEAYLIKTLQTAAISKKSGNLPRSHAERTAAVTSLLTFKVTGAADTALDIVKSSLKAELSTVKSTKERDNVRSLIAVLN